MSEPDSSPRDRTASPPSRSRGEFLVISNLETPFVSIDLEIIRSRYGAIPLVVERSVSGLLDLVRRCLRASAGIGWFASWHTLPAALVFGLLRRPFLLIIGGYDLANLPEIDYGHQRGGAKKWIARATMRLASRLMTNSEFSRREALENAHLDDRPISVVYHGVRDLFGSPPDGSGDDLVVTVGNVDRANLRRKGHEPFVRAAALLPEVEFRLVGGWRDDAIDFLRSIATPNVTFAGRVSDDELKRTLVGASVYVQVSLHEGFGMSLAEAMLAECVPVVSARGAIPEVVGSSGLYVNESDPESIARGIRRGLASRTTLGPRARTRILRHFPLTVRRDGLLSEATAMMETSGVVI